LRPGVTFLNGQAFTSADVIASFERARAHPRSGIVHQLTGIRRMVAVGDRTLEVETDGPSPTLLNRLAFLFIVPAKDATATEITTPIGTGPYRFAGRDESGAITGESWTSWRGQPQIPRFVFSFLDEETRVRRVVDGSLDVATNIPEQSLAEIQSIPGRRLLSQPILAVRMIMVIPDAARGPARTALADPRVRRVMVMALDRSGLASNVLKGNAVVATQYVHPSVFGFDPAISPLPYDPEQARRLLAEAGFPTGFDTTMVFGSLNTEIVRCLVADWQAVGIRVRAVQLPFPEMMRSAREARHPLVLFARTSTTGDASELFDSSLHTSLPEKGLGRENYTHYSDPQTDNLLDAASRELNPQERLQLLQQAQRRVLDAMPLLPIIVQWNYVGVSDRLDIVVRFDEWNWVAAYRWRS
jgi:peptide/nickel transport system substrate-binding protein